MEQIVYTADKKVRTVCTVQLVSPKNQLIQGKSRNMLKTPANNSNLSSANKNKVEMNPFPKISLQQMNVLENEFLKLKTLHNTDLELLAAELGLDEKDVKDWYHERLAAWRRGQGLSDTFGQL